MYYIKRSNCVIHIITLQSVQHYARGKYLKERAGLTLRVLSVIYL